MTVSPGLAALMPAWIVGWSAGTWMTEAAAALMRIQDSRAERSVFKAESPMRISGGGIVDRKARLYKRFCFIAADKCATFCISRWRQQRVRLGIEAADLGDSSGEVARLQL